MLVFHSHRIGCLISVAAGGCGWVWYFMVRFTRMYKIGWRLECHLNTSNQSQGMGRLDLTEFQALWEKLQKWTVRIFGCLQYFNARRVCLIYNEDETVEGEAVWVSCHMTDWIIWLRSSHVTKIIYELNYEWKRLKLSPKLPSCPKFVEMNEIISFIYNKYEVYIK